MGFQGRRRCGWGLGIWGVMMHTASASSSRARCAPSVDTAAEERIVCTTPCCARGDRPGYLELLSSPVALIRLS
jgi:hypothetical protein